MGSPHPTPRILVVEDDPFIARTFERMLVAAGYRVSVTVTAEAALEHLAHGSPDALLLDLRLPRINGLGLLYRIRAQERSTRLPVLVVTGTPLNDETLDELSALNASVYYKPISLAELVEQLRGLLGELHGAEHTCYVSSPTTFPASRCSLSWKNIFVICTSSHHG